MITLYGSLTSPYVRKVRVLLHEKSVDCAFVPDDPRLPDSHAQRMNPLGKVPTLALADGTVLYDSPVIMEYLDGLTGSPWIPPGGPDRWTVLCHQALADGMMDAVVRRYQERQRPEAQRSDTVLAGEARRLDRALAALEPHALASGFLHGDRLGLADVCVAVALAYIDLRDPSDWRARYPGLAVWQATLAARPSMAATVPPAG